MENADVLTVSIFKTILKEEFRTFKKEIIQEVMQKMDEKLAEQKKKIIQEVMQKMNEKLAEQKKEILKNTKEKIKEGLDKQSKEVAEELRNVAEYICHRQDKAINEIKMIVNQQEKSIYTIEKEQESNKIAHDGYNANIYKIQLAQSNLEEKVFDLEKTKKVAVY